jgi:hypothetical protein
MGIIARGSRARLVGGIQEVSFKTLPASPHGVVLPFNKSTLAATQPLNVPQTMRGIRSPASPFTGYVDVKGDVDVPVDDIAFGYWLCMFMGYPTVTGTGPYTHYFTIQNDLPSFCIEQQYLDQILFQQFTGCKVNSFKTTIVADRELLVTMGVVGAVEAIGTTPTDANPDIPAFNRFYACNVKAYINGGLAAIVSEIQLTLDNKIDESVYTLTGGGFRGATPEGVMALSGQMKMFFQDWTLYTQAMNQTPMAIQIQMNGTGAAAGHSIMIELQEVVLKRQSPGVPGPGAIWLTTPFEAYWSTGAANSGLTVTMINGLSSYQYANIPVQTATTTTTTTTTSTTSTTITF